jgi:hypothetical protein
MTGSLVQDCGLQDRQIVMFDFYLWGNPKGKVYRNTPHTVEALQNEIRNAVASISADKFQCISKGFL